MTSGVSKHGSKHDIIRFGAQQAFKCKWRWKYFKPPILVISLAITFFFAYTQAYSIFY
jgi:hypothetical protein